jgi:predicted transposase/invertase (TIGR01784 family)
MTVQSKYINPFTDFGFKRIFGEESNKDILLDFLNEILAPQGISIKDLTYKKNDHYPISKEDRKVIFDLYCENEKGEKFTIELQKAKQDHFKDRMLYYSTFSIQEQGIQGSWDYKLKAIYVIAILDFIFDETDKNKVISYIQLTDKETNKSFSEKLNFITLEIRKFNKTEEELVTNLDKWLYVLKHLHELEKIPIKLQTKILEKVFKVAEFIALNKEEKRNYVESLKNYNDLQNTLDTSERTGYQKGLQELTPLLEEAKAREEEERRLKEEAIKLMIEVGIPLETIAEKLNISIEEINKII